MLITDQPIDLNKFTVLHPPEDCGGSVYFIGRVRNHHEGKKVKRLFYECYKPMAEKEISKIISSVASETNVMEIRVIHRIGWLGIGDIAIAIAASGTHRAEAFDACRKVIDRVKESVPIWKKEVYEDGTHDWVVCQHVEPHSRMPNKEIRYGVILAGGRSRRFGSDKALALYEGKPLVSRAVDLVRSAGLVACVITEQCRDYSFLDCPIYFDRQSFRGPLSGLERAFEVFPDEKILALTCDMPFLTEEDIRCLLEKNQAEATAVLYRLCSNRFQPFPGIYSPFLKSALHLDDGKKNSMQDFLKSAKGILEIDASGSMNNFSNINGPEDFSRAIYDTGHNEF